ncbi:lipoyl(octanoyl) transferase LipB [Buchnera aphidicola]|uniref:Octanoyltransferase n=1 Tax=Buchnera aphidicola subsp. Tuberolachnus salignus TaxID=98804 RepID=A0A160SZ02_BUCTT|nr:lipoyl(octanoyl) transferase LipB [Buchnera aphidicola]CUR53156.1 Octanoyltransferase [Buchnera aphidicola (Tuberolachnus salignus)]
MSIIIRDFGLSDWNSINFSMQYFTMFRHSKTIDEIWILEHYPVFTRGFLEKSKFVPYIQKIPVFLVNRGGKMTYHGPGQLIIYFLIDLKKNKILLSYFIQKMLFIMKKTLRYFSILAFEKKKFPGLYVQNKKICSFGLRITRGCVMHGFSINVKMDLFPFTFINVCGKKNLEMVDMYFYNKNVTINSVKKEILKNIVKSFSNVDLLTLSI